MIISWWNLDVGIYVDLLQKHSICQDFDILQKTRVRLWVHSFPLASGGIVKHSCLISFGSNSPRLAATSDALAIELYDAC
jgi:hypothetical protein